ncbi:peptide deformylase [Helicobacter cinaedi PAGU611]|uniref:Peptide deformylase n=1 Tax=Helicobacter cinaedi CCUG 18818 = ATCC BAA-847 TaxID=537971 RepID=A0AAI8MHP7_9HELI|nr:peptide deformylase [Helicobacter cinaedi]BAM11713.1 peptide deformylase [Helicobacter cinaedi PAGU611]BAM31682.1 peptide deformylase [Helicobacter cinaedi CCUG 18818 = ATCC BAA-847]BBB19270.1 peptide deformylase [Helicobacter cinaedi]
MATLAILKYPNPILRQKSTKVESFDESLHTLLDDMYETMIESGGVGLAAIQVGIAKRILVINLPRDEDKQQYKEDLLEVINPTFLTQEDDIEWEEGCLSVPEFYESVKRFNKVSVAYKDRFGNDKILQAEGFLAVALQHEIDHLNGILFVDKLPILRRKKFEKELKKLKNQKT